MLPKFIGGLVAHEFHASGRIQLPQQTETATTISSFAKHLQPTQLPLEIQRLAHDFVNDLLIRQALRLRPQVVAQQCSLLKKSGSQKY